MMEIGLKLNVVSGEQAEQVREQMTKSPLLQALGSIYREKEAVVYIYSIGRVKY
jgi:hypothetical protein